MTSARDEADRIVLLRSERARLRDAIEAAITAAEKAGIERAAKVAEVAAFALRQHNRFDCADIVDALVGDIRDLRGLSEYGSVRHTHDHTR